MIRKDFAGLNGFVWWVGVVEDRNDPLKLGHCRVRIIGWHPEEKSLLPTKDLPWSQTLQSVNSPNSYSVPREGEWVMGYFMDGELANKPVVMGVFPGIQMYNNDPSKGFNDPRTAAQKAAGPQIPAGTQDRFVGQPTNSPLARGEVSKSMIHITNNQRAHVCDITTELQKNSALARAKFSSFLQAVRKQLRALLAALGLEPSGEISKLVSLAKAIVRELKNINKILKEILDLSRVLIDFARKVRAMIDYILGLPAKLLAMFRECLAEFLSALANGFKDLFALGSGSETDVSALIKEIELATNEAKQIISNSATIAAVPAAIIGILATPASAADVQAAGNTLTSYIATNSTSSSEAANTYGYTSSTASSP
jgi:hypothetical protein